MKNPEVQSRISSADYAGYLTEQIEHALLDRFQRYSQKGWEENAITTELCWNLSEHSGHQVDLEGKNAAIRWMAQRNGGRLEYDTGDIGLIVRYKYISGEIVVGFAHLEAKRIFFNEDKKTGSPIVGTGNFKSLNREQIIKHLENTHAHYVLLYDIVNDNIALATNVISPRFLSLHNRDGGLHHAGENLGGVLVHQFIRGYGLEYGGSIEEHICKWAGGRGVDFVLIGDVSEQDDGDRMNEGHSGGDQGPGPGGIGLMETVEAHGFLPISAFIEETTKKTLLNVETRESTKDSVCPSARNKNFLER